MKTYTITKHPWHIGHDYELVKLPHRFHFLKSTNRRWSTGHRPIPKKIRWVQNLSETNCDLMILDVDHWSYFMPSKRLVFERLRDQYKGPKIVINHGCNMVDGCSSETMQELVRGCYMVCNSNTAHRLWGVSDSRFIRHGMSPEEWGPTNYAGNNVIVVQAPVISGYFTRVRNEAGVKKAERRVKITWVGRDLRFSTFDAYRHFLRNSSIFFNPSYASCNPRARTEAMLCGLAVVTTNSHGEDEYIRNGENGYCSNDMDELIDYLVYLEKNPAMARKIGMAGRETAQSVFHIDQFIEQWNDLLTYVMEG